MLKYFNKTATLFIQSNWTESYFYVINPGIPGYLAGTFSYSKVHIY